MLLLDEPTNHLDLPGIEWLRRALAGMHLGKLRGQPRPPAAGAPLSATIWLGRGIARTLNEASRRSSRGVMCCWRSCSARNSHDDRQPARQVGLSRPEADHAVNAGHERGAARQMGAQCFEIGAGGNMPSIVEQHVVVLGGTSGFGFATAKAALAEGAKVTIASRSAEKLRGALVRLGNAASGEWVCRRQSNARASSSELGERIATIDRKGHPLPYI
jgi:hypothetical protein